MTWYLWLSFILPVIFSFVVQVTRQVKDATRHEATMSKLASDRAKMRQLAAEPQRGLVHMNVEPPRGEGHNFYASTEPVGGKAPPGADEMHTLDDIEAEMNKSIERFHQSRGGCDVWMTDPIEPLPADAEIPLPQALVGGGTTYGQPRGASKPAFQPDEALISDSESAARQAMKAWESMKPPRQPVIEAMAQPSEAIGERLAETNHVPVYRPDGSYVGMRHMTATEMRDARIARIPKERRELAGEALTLSVLSGIGAGDCLRMLNDGWHRAEARWDDPNIPIDYDG